MKKQQTAMHKKGAGFNSYILQQILKFIFLVSFLEININNLSKLSHSAYCFCLNKFVFFTFYILWDHHPKFWLKQLDKFELFLSHASKVAECGYLGNHYLYVCPEIIPYICTSEFD